MSSHGTQSGAKTSSSVGGGQQPSTYEVYADCADVAVSVGVILHGQKPMARVVCLSHQHSYSQLLLRSLSSPQNEAAGNSCRLQSLQ